MRVCVFCSSREGVADRYQRFARRLGRRLGERGDTLVYGGTDIGLMGALSRAARQAGGEVVGIVPAPMVDRGLADEQASRLIVTHGLAERETRMLELAEAFCVLPGGLGTLEELLEVTTLRHLGYHDKPILLADVGGFYRPLLALFDELVDQGFAEADLHDLYRRVETLDELIACLDEHGAAGVTRPPAPGASR